MFDYASPVLYPCAACGTQNRFPRARATENPKCGACGEKIFPAKPVTVTDKNWRVQVEECPIPVLVDFWASWCQPCHMVAPSLEQIAAERAGKLKIAKLEVEENPVTASRFGIRSIPTMLVFRDGAALDLAIQGAQPKSAIEAALDRL